MHLACHSLRVFLAILSVHLIGDTIFCMQVRMEMWIMFEKESSNMYSLTATKENFIDILNVIYYVFLIEASIYHTCKNASKR